jgi:lysophospholipase L1-like esterase
MAYMKGSDGIRLDTIPVKTRLDGLESLGDLIAGQFPAPDQRRLYGPVTVDMPDVNLNIAAANPPYNQQYIISGGVLPAGWPVDTGDAPVTIAGNYITYVSAGNSALQPRRYRFMCDADRVAFLINSGSAGGLVWGDFFLYVDGAPVSLTKYDPAAGNQYQELVFDDARPRLIEILTCAPLNSVYCPKPYRCWMPPEPTGIKALIAGDSYTAGGTIIGGTLASPTVGDYIQGFAPQLGLELGVGSWSTDGVGGTGYIRRNIGNSNYNDRAAEHIARAPDAIIVGGGGSNDLFHGHSVNDIVAAATTYFTTVRAGLPNAKLVFMEGFAPPVGFSTFNDEYTAIRTQLQAALDDVGVYYIDIATSAAWLDGSGYVGATTGIGNSDIYVGNDGIHPSPAGNRYIQKRLAPKIRAALADNGDLVNTLI